MYKSIVLVPKNVQRYYAECWCLSYIKISPQESSSIAKICEILRQTDALRKSANKDIFF